MHPDKMWTLSPTSKEGFEKTSASSCSSSFY